MHIHNETTCKIHHGWFYGWFYFLIQSKVPCPINNVLQSCISLALIVQTVHTTSSREPCKCIITDQKKINFISISKAYHVFKKKKNHCLFSLLCRKQRASVLQWTCARSGAPWIWASSYYFYPIRFLLELHREAERQEAGGWSKSRPMMPLWVTGEAQSRGRRSLKHCELGSVLCVETLCVAFHSLIQRRGAFTFTRQCFVVCLV